LNAQLEGRARDTQAYTSKVQRSGSEVTLSLDGWLAIKILGALAEPGAGDLCNHKEAHPSVTLARQVYKISEYNII